MEIDAALTRAYGNKRQFAAMENVMDA